jgi:hypothetical protein
MPDRICIQVQCNPTYVILTGGSPVGGYYSGTGIQNGIFNTSVGTGTYNVKYFYTDSNGCIGISNNAHDSCSGAG